ncbi:response regulator [Limibacter armeniacum]|uniref:response regulator n=1 Tax=Limibacter armeniacum TaxID=466084 RepID=UPI002FE597A1
MTITEKFKNASIQRKIVWIIMLVSTVSLVLASAFFFTYDFVSYRNKMIRDVSQLAKIIGDNNDASVELNQQVAAQRNLYEILSRDPHILQGAIFDKRQRLFAFYDVRLLQNPESGEEEYVTIKETTDSEKTHTSPTFSEESVRFDFFANHLDIFVSTYDDNGRINTVFLRSELEVFYDRLLRYLGVYIIFFACTLLVSYILSIKLQSFISKPILDLAQVTKRISSNKDYSIRIDYDRNDEIDTLISAFNGMLSEIGTQNESLVRAKEEAELSAKAKQEFLANMSHEIRTPMNGVIGVADLLGETDLNTQQKKYLDIIRNSADNLLVIINDILDLSKIESGKMVFEDGVIQLSRVIDTVIASCMPKLEAKKLQVNVEHDPDVPASIIGDAVRLNQILLNLFSNAIKFTIKGYVTLGYKLQDETSDDVLLRFYVKDTGIGIPRDKFEAIFTSFTQATSDTTRKFGGTGLGLSISRQLVELQGGKMFLESELGKGSVFSFELKFKKQSEVTIDSVDEHAAVEQEKEVYATGKHKILLAEDNDVNQMLVVTLLNQWGYEVDVAENGKVAVEMLENNSYGLILMDVHMPEMDGYSATRKIRSMMKAPKNEVPIIAMTASALKGEADRCIAAGMDDYISKPFNKNILYEKIARTLAIYEG